MVKLHQFGVPTEGIRYQNPMVSAFLDKEDLGKGTIYVTESSLSWINTSSGEGFSIQYPQMTLHAISRDENIHSSPSLYVMVNGTLEDVEIVHNPGEDDETSSLDSSEVITEIIFVPDDSEILEILYASVKDCTLLHPDSASELSEENDDDDVAGAGGDFENDDDSEEDGFGPSNGGGVSFGSRVLYRNDPPQPGQFDDAEI